jgi:hypothetical protein
MHLPGRTPGWRRRAVNRFQRFAMVQGNSALASLTSPKEAMRYNIKRQSYHYRMAVVAFSSFRDANENKKEEDNMRPQRAYI